MLSADFFPSFQWFNLKYKFARFYARCEKVFDLFVCVSQSYAVVFELLDIKQQLKVAVILMYFSCVDFSGMERHSLSQSDSLLPTINHQHQPMTGFILSNIFLTSCITLNFLTYFVNA